MSKMHVEWTAHADFERMLAEVFQDDPIEGIKELVANGFDADATRFDLSYNCDGRVLIAKDNGTGMGIYELRQGFYKSGDSLTRRAGKTKRGRTPMGSYGIGTIVMQYLAKSYRLETWRDGQKLSVEESFPEGKRPKKILEAIPESCAPSLHGTTITIDPIRFSPDEVSLEKLIKRLALGINVQSRLETGDSFDIYVNDTKVELKNPNPALVFMINKHDSLIGQVYGRVNFYQIIPPYNGVIVSVNGRQVGSENFFDDLMPPLMRERIYANIDVDLMVSKISFSRARFQEDSPHFQRLVSILEQTFKSIRVEVDDYISQKQLNTARNALESTLSQTSDRLRSLETERELGDILLSTDTKEGYKMVLTSDKSPSFGAVDSSKKILWVNVNHPYFIVSGQAVERSLQIQVLYALSQILGQHKYESEASCKDAGEIIVARNEIISRLTQEIFGGQKRLVDALMSRRKDFSTMDISHDRMYTQTELAHESPIDSMWLHKFQKAGLLKPTIATDAEERYYGANIILALERLKRGTPAFQLVREYYNAEKIDVMKQAANESIHSVDHSIAGLKTKLPYVFDISVTNTPLFVVMLGYEGVFTQLYREGYIKKRYTIPKKFLNLEKIAASASPKNTAVVRESADSDYIQFAAHERRHPGLIEEQLKRATAYNTIDRYDKGDIVLHEGFGYGVVIDVSNKSCIVQFKGQQITLAHNRQIISLLPHP